MKCNKCGTPIIPGESTCRICGNKTDFSERGNEPEIIDFPEDSKEEMKMEEIALELPDLDNIVGFDEKEEVKELDSENIISKEEKKELPKKNVKKETLKEPIIEDEFEDELEKPKKSKKNVLDRASSKEENKKPEKRSKSKEKSSISIGTILLILILMCSIAGNIYLFIMNGNAKASEKTLPTENKTVYSKVAYNKYKLTIPSTWITTIENNNLLIYDDTQNWATSARVINNANYEVFVNNKDKLVDSLGTLKYQFTSNYSKKIENREYYLFKGKYYNYSVYVIVTEIDDKSLLAVDLKFKGEVDDILLNNIMTSMATIKDKGTDELFKDNFEFNDISSQISTISQNNE